MLGTGPLDIPAGKALRGKIAELQNRMSQPAWQRLLEELAEEIQGEFHLQRLLERIMDAMISITRAQRGFLILTEHGTLQFKVRRNIDHQTLKGSFCEVSENIIRSVAKTGEIFLSSNAVEDPRLLNFPSVQALRLRSILAVPFRFRKKNVGAVYLDNRTSSDSFAETNLAVVRSFAAMASQAILVAELVTRLKHRMRQLDLANHKLKDENRLQSLELRRKDEHLARTERTLKRRYSYDNIVGQGPAMQRVFDILDRVIPGESTALITGETGTGKELIARAIHFLGPRKTEPFVPLNCAALPEALLESELFGHVKGAFTGALADKMGLARLAHGGTLFLDEIGEMPTPLQAKLLRMIQEGEVRPVGDVRSTKVDVRLVAATNRDLRTLTDKGVFRKDLYYRLSVLCIPLPPLRERLEDIPSLVKAIAARLQRDEAMPPRTFEPDALEPLRRHSWPGNVRELENLVERLLTFSPGRITKAHVAHELSTAAPDAAPGLPAGGVDLKEALTRLERDLLRSALEATRNKSEAARRLRIDRTWFLRLLKKHQLA